MKKKSKNPFGFVRVAVAALLCISALALAFVGFAMRTSAHSNVAARARLQGVPTLAVSDAPSSNPLIAAWQQLAAYSMPYAPQRLLLRRAASAASSFGSAAGSRMQVSPSLSTAGVASTVSPPLRDLPPTNQFSAWVEQPEPRTPESRLPQLPRNPFEFDPVVQNTAPTVGMPGVGASFEGMSISTACGSCLPPDTNGAAGPNHYVQMVNSSIAVYSKAGATLMSPRAINTLWSATPNSECFTHNNGDPIVLYDQLADRWLVSQFVVQASTENYAQCIAISQTPDPTGAYYLYEFDESADVFFDYPHIGVWPDGYYMTSNQFPNSTTGTVAAGAWVFERPKMLQGQTARYVFFDETPLAQNCVAGNCTYTPFGQLPTNLDGKTLPPTGTPNFFAETDDVNQPNTPPATGLHDEMRLWKFHVDWNNPANSTFGVGSSAPAAKPGFPGLFTGVAGQPDKILQIADYLASACQIENGPNDCTPQKVNPPQPAQYLDVLGDRLMHRMAYRNFGDHEALVVNHTVDVVDPSSGTGRNGIRWYEIRDPNATPVVYQQGTFAPLDAANPLWRWMGSVALDHVGNIATGYSASGPNYFPSLHYAGRLVGDPLNELTQGEAVMFLGQGIEANTGLYPFRNRWGDYSAMAVDPSDDCTFWYTNEYLAPNAPTDILPVDWHTRIGSFKFPQCVTPPPVTLTGAVSRKVHGAAGTFDVNLPLIGAHGIECRTGGTNNDYTVILTFLNPLNGVGGARITQGTATVNNNSGIGPNPNQYTVNLTGVSNAQHLGITVFGVHDNMGNVSDAVEVLMDVLVGDINAASGVTGSDVNLCQAQVGSTLTADNFRADINATGFVSGSDVNLVRAQVGMVLP